MKKRIFPMLILLLGGAVVPLFAHPHLFLDNQVEVVIEGNDILKELRFHWTFDAMYSAGLVRDYDRNGDRLFSPDETAALKSGAFDNLSNYDYFLIMYYKDKKLPTVRSVSRFEASIGDKNRVTYHFSVPLNIPLAEGDSELIVSAFDTTCFSAFKYDEENPLICRGISSDRYAVEVGENKDRPFYYDPYAGMSQTFDSSVYRQGMLVMYPEEMRLRFEL